MRFSILRKCENRMNTKTNRNERKRQILPFETAVLYAKKDLSVAEAVARIVRVRIVGIVCHGQCGQNCYHHKNLALAQLSVLPKCQQHNQQKQKPIVFKHSILL